MGRAKKVFAPLNDKYAGKSIMPGTFLWFVSFVHKKSGMTLYYKHNSYGKEMNSIANTTNL